MVELLQERLLQILSNPDEVEVGLVETISAEALEIVGDRDLAQPLILDIAVYRYLLVKGDLRTDAYERAYKDALKKLQEAPRSTSDTETEASDYGIAVGSRSAAWI